MSDEPLLLSYMSGSNAILSLFGLADEPSAPGSLAAPTRDDAASRASKEARQAGLLRRAAGQGRRNTVLTTSQGDMTPATIQRVSVLGGTS